MHTTWKMKTAIVLGLALLGCLLLSHTQTANARPQYTKQFVVDYPALKDLAKKAKCKICHPEKKKKVINSYGKAMKEGLPGKKKNCKDKPAITKAFKDSEPKPSDIPGKTFGDLIKEGKLPNATE